jgi:hypothetical protein
MYHKSDVSPTKQRAYRILMGLILLMFFLETILIILDIYQLWLAFARYAESPHEILAILEGDEIDSRMVALVGMQELLTTSKIAIADSIMVSLSMLSPRLLFLIIFI